MSFRKLGNVDESGVDRSYFHGAISREEAVARLEKANGGRPKHGTFLLRMSTQSGQKDVYTLSLVVDSEIKHIRVNNEGDKYTLGKSKEEYDAIWDLVEAQLDRCLKSTSGDKTVELLYPLPCTNGEAIAPDLLKGAAEAGMDSSSFDPDVMAFMTGSISTEELARRRAAIKAAKK